MIAPILYLTFLTAFISLAAVDQTKGVGIIYRTDGELFNMRRLKAKTKVKATSIVYLEHADDYAITAHTRERACGEPNPKVSQRFINVWDKFSTESVHASSVNMFKNRIDKSHIYNKGRLHLELYE